MKKIYSIIFAVLLPLLTFAQQHQYSELPKLLDDKKLCLDPGHGGHDGDDREIYLGYGLTFWESDGNFFQANFAAEILESLGAEVKVTRYTNDSHDVNRQPSLSERVAIGNAFDADFFHSIHTNAGSGTANYTSVYQHKNTSVYTPEQNKMSKIMNNVIFDVVYTTGKYDKSANFGVLRGNNQPAVLTEACMHDYIKEGRRLNNDRYKMAMAYSYVRGYLEFYDAGVFPYGEIGGRIFYKYGYKPVGFNPNNYDHGEEVNQAKVTLYKSGVELDSQYTDRAYDGYYFFDMLEEGDYTIKIEKDGMPTQTEVVTVVKGSLAKKDIVFDQSPVVETSNAPELVFVGQPENGGNGVSAKWIKSKIDGLVGYKLYWSSDLLNWKLVADESTLTADVPTTRNVVSINIEDVSDFIDTPTAEAKYFKVVAIGTVTSSDSEIYVKSKLSGAKKVLIADAFQSKTGDIQIDESIARGYLNSLSKISSIGSISTINSDRIWDSYLDINDYDIIVWVLANEKTEDENFSLKETVFVKKFLEQGGKIIVSGSDVGYDMIINGKRNSEQNFYTDYLKAKCSADYSGTTGTGIGVDGTYLEGVNLNFASDALKYPTDEITPWGGSEVILKDENGKDVAVAYSGVYGTSIVVGRLAYFAFPLESLSQSQLDNVIEKTFDYFDEFVLPPPPPKPEVSEILAVEANSGNDGVVVRWTKSTNKYIAGYNVYFAEAGSPDSWKLAVAYDNVDATSRSVEIKFSSFVDAPIDESNLRFKTTAVAFSNEQAVEGDESDVLCLAKHRGILDVLVVDGFDRTYSGFDGSINLLEVQTNVLIKNELIRSVSTCPNEGITKVGGVDLTKYHTVIWISGEESTQEETFSDDEQIKVKAYLENGGALFVSGAEIGWDLGKKGSDSDKLFYANYLKANFVNDGSSDYKTANGVSGSLFDGVQFEFSKLWSANYPDVISAVSGAENVFTYTDGVYSGVSYKGKFGASDKTGGVVYLSFPIETAEAADLEIVHNNILEYFQELAKNTAPFAKNDKAQAISETSVEIDVLTNDVDGDDDIEKSTVTIVRDPLNGVASVLNGMINYTSNPGFVGNDTLSYTVADATGKVSSIAIVAIKIIQGSGLPHELEVDANHPKRDMRAVFLATVSNLDWPFSSGNSAEKQQSNLIAILKKFEDANVNTVMFQARPAADVLYKSTIEPWSTVLTGTQGQDPGYDPLQFAIDESHSRGMELHAWVNPYRTYAGKSSTVGTGNPSAMQIENKHPEWILVSNQGRHILNPGIPEVIDYVVSVVDELARNYDVDGIHFDDYFYFYEGTPDALDDAEFAANNPNGLAKDDWRRANVDKLMDAVNIKIQEINVEQKKNIIFGISPFGIWKNGVPEGISGMDSYSVIFADPISWLEKGYVDYLAPQLYWKIGGAQDYDKLSNWWNDKVAEHGRYNMPSQGLYRLKDSNWSSQEIIDQIALNRKEENKNTLGQIFFRALNLARNDKRIINELKKSSFQYPSISASYIWKEDVAPNKPESLVYSDGELSWSKPSFASDSDTARRYVVYRFNSMEELITDKHNGRRIVAVSGETSIVVPDSWLNYGENFLCVSALDKNNNESVLSNVVVIDNRPEYCDVKGKDSSSEWIEKVKFFNVENKSGNNNGYADFTNKKFYLRVGAETEIVLSPGFSGASLSQHWKVFIDLNNDGDFSDNGETILATTSSRETDVKKFISLPLSTKEGVFRMRIMMEGTSSSNNIDACTDIEKGEVEDYLVVLSRDELSNDDLSLNEIEGAVFPNPFSEQLNFTLQSEKSEEVELAVYSFTGQIIFNKKFNKTVGENNFTINSSSWSQGVYLLLVRDESGRKTVYELIKK
ncbi:MAG: family 10 glycosylhydrolase [Flavobacteriales bacterium]|nr:family 10 glycosylhydrolase [Flavobacteriales bacterium]